MAEGGTREGGSEILEGHGGDLALAAAGQHGVTTLFTLSGAHVFPLYDAAVKAEPPVRIVDVRHEQTAVFAAEATGKLTRTPGLAALTAGPGVTNGVSAIAQAHFAGSPLVVIGGRAPDALWGRGSLQELDQPPIVAGVTAYAETAHDVASIPKYVDQAFRAASTPHRGPAFLDIAMDAFFATGKAELPAFSNGGVTVPASGDLEEISALLGAAERPILILGGDVWAGSAEHAALRLVDDLAIPVITNGMGRGVIPRGHRMLVTKARSMAYGNCDLAIVVGTPLDFRLNYGRFGGKADAPPAKVVHIADAANQLATHRPLDGSAAGDLTTALDAIRHTVSRSAMPPTWTAWVSALQAATLQAASADKAFLESHASPAHPARIYGELLPRLDDDSVVIGDGGDFVSFAGRFIEPARPGGWLDPGPFGCLGAGLGAAIGARLARPSAQIVLLLGDGAAGMSLMDVDTLVRHRLPVVMIVGNNSGWGLEKHPMRSVYGYDVAADLGHATRYDQVATALGAEGELVEGPSDIGPALDRAFAAGVPYLVNILTDPEAAYPRTTTGV